MIKLEVVVILFFRAHKVTTFFHIISINMLYFMLFNIKYLDIAILWKWCSWFFFVKTLVCLKYIRTFAPLLTKSTSDKEVLERWQSGRLRRSWKPLYCEVPGVRIPVSPLNVLNRNGQQTDKKLQINDLWLFLLPESPASKTSKVR